MKLVVVVVAVEEEACSEFRADMYVLPGREVDDDDGDNCSAGLGC